MDTLGFAFVLVALPDLLLVEIEILDWLVVVGCSFELAIRVQVLLEDDGVGVGGPPRVRVLRLVGRAQHARREVMVAPSRALQARVPVGHVRLVEAGRVVLVSRAQKVLLRLMLGVFRRGQRRDIQRVVRLLLDCLGHFHAFTRVGGET